MYQSLLHNFDVIQYLVENASTEQLTWRKDDQGCSLDDILHRARDEEVCHAYIAVPGLKHGIQQRNGHKNLNGHTFDDYARYRRKTVDLLREISPANGQCKAVHKRYGEVTLPELVARINESDRAYIRQIEDVIHTMPQNPLFSRALHEIADYHARYRPHLLPASSLLDIGVGSGLALRHVMTHNLHLTAEGVDVRDLRLADVGVPLQLYNGHTLPFETNRFDVSLIFYVLHHCRDSRRVLSEATRVTRHKLVIIEEFDYPGADETSLDLTERQSHRALGIPPDLFYHLFDKPEFEQMLQACGLIQLEQQLLPSNTTRPVQKYLYVVQVAK